MTQSRPPGLPEVRGARILVLSTVAQSLANQMPDAWKYLKESGAELTFASHADGWEDLLVEWGAHIPIRTSRKPSIRGARQARQDLGALIGDGEWSMIQAQTPIVGALARTLRRRGTPLLYVAHGFHFHRDGGRAANIAYGSVETALAPRADAIAVVCQEDYDRAKSLMMDRRALLWHLPGAGVDLAPFSFNELRVRPDGPMNLLFIGEMNDNKDPIRVVRVARLLAERMRVQLVMVGSGPLQGEVERMLMTSALDARVVRRTTLVPDLMREADVLLAPSQREGLPRVVIEALASRLPVVAQSNRGTRELLGGGLGITLSGDASDSEWADSVALAPRAINVEAGALRAEKYGTQPFLASYGRLIVSILDRASSRRRISWQ